jgi:very-short-patch-repair endonuclease
MSSLESIIQAMLTDLGVDCQRQVKIGSYFADFVIGNIIIECDGLYWHSEIHKDDKYHVKKRQFYIDSGFKPLFFRQDEIINKPDIIKSIILNKLNKSDRFFARKCTISGVPKKIAKKFFEQNHLMGNGGGDSFGLYYNDDLISCIQIRKSKGSSEISRFCNKLGVSVIGGFSRLAKNWPNLFTFIDLRYGDGDYLIDLGFKRLKSYPSFKWTDGSSTFHRMKYQSNTGYSNGMYKIWDCGQLKYERN